MHLGSSELCPDSYRDVNGERESSLRILWAESAESLSFKTLRTSNIPEFEQPS